MENREAALHPLTNELWFYTAVEETQNDMPELLWEAVLNEENAIPPGTVPQAQGEDVTENLCRDVQDCPEVRRIGDEGKAAVIELVTEEPVALVGE